MMTDNNKVSMETEYLYRGDHIDGVDFRPESIPIFMTTSFTMDNLYDVENRYAEGGYTYIRTNNPTRDALGEVITYLEKGKATDIFSSGMGAITSSLLTVVEPGDNVIYNNFIYGETYNVMDEILKDKMHAEIKKISFDNIEDVRAAVNEKTKVIFAEVVSNPTMKLADIPALAEIAHSVGAYLIVDNTFTTPFSVRPLEMGADIVINSLTKFLNGHTDVAGGSVTVNDEELLKKIHHMSMLCGTPADPFISWMILRGLHTAALRIPRQMENALKLARALENHPLIAGVNHPGLESNPQIELSRRLGGENGVGCALLSIYLPDDIDRISAFMDRLQFAKYAPNLGGIKTTLSHPISSSHRFVPEEARLAMGITHGLMRISVGTENADDLIRDFTEALKVFEEQKI